ncbi:Ribosomal RNA small subunit methyltransferase B [Candidatus Hydrogenisulfobacillus filiaventi]|uniref:16S rRNA (cytosine(967)-C(5))-methyltransferase n=1 Tax=Candidatus Hydrogenisulfobacillus filiaventi TaxID=2707344 RepID=A0A6F8ZI97_9FIRM|nr:16S rRNA (cytosine(967)-C(5))-methyltransferase RsmB [Bacillota bacterium]CAB1129181.1 Ribosomal RNA small subunit methyltransferase B [Candidatus Hydrogenisulfobacillus filiaventi]
MTGPGPARAEALNVLRLVREGMPVNEALARRTHEVTLSPSDRSLMAQLVYGVLRHRRYLDAWIDQYKRGNLEPDIEDILRMGFFQIGFLNRIPSYAVVHAAVEHAKLVQPRAAGLVNAILRRGAVGPRPEPEDLGVRYSHPDWLVERWRQRFGPDLERILAEDNRVPPLTLRVNLERTTREAVLEALERDGIRAEPSPYLPEGIRVSGSLWLEEWEPFRRGWVTVQDESGMLVTWVLDPQPGESIIDLAAGLGGKATHVLERLHGQGHVRAVDLSPHRIELLRDNVARLGFASHISFEVNDARTAAARDPGRYDRVILDAPCSGLGVLRRRVDARWKKTLHDIHQLAGLQLALFGAAVQAVRPGGVIVYSTCSVEPEETEEVVAQARHRWPGLAVEAVTPYLPHPALQGYVTPEGYLRLLPGDLGMDGFFIARLRAPAAAEEGGTL